MPEHYEFNIDSLLSAVHRQYTALGTQPGVANSANIQSDQMTAIRNAAKDFTLQPMTVDDILKKRGIRNYGSR